MKRNLWKRIGAVALAIAVSLTMGVTSFAADNPSTAGPTNANGGIETNSTSIDIPKGITVKGTLAKTFGPKITYSYEITPCSADDVAGKTIYDGNTTVSVKPGVTGSVSLSNSGNVAFESTQVDTPNHSGEVTGKLTVNVDTSKFTLPGVYRYVIEDKTSLSDLYNAGINRPTDYITKRWLDVYIKKAANSDELIVYGYVLQSSNYEATTKDKNAKSQGYVAASEDNGKKTDVYQTIDAKIGKKITGTMADTGHSFPFTIAVENVAGDNQALSYYAKVGGDPTVTDVTNDSSVSVSLGNSVTYYMTGLNPRAKITYTEQNDTADTYTLTVTATGEGGNTVLINAEQVAASASKGTSALVVSNYIESNSATNVSVEPTPSVNTTVTFENNLEAISPTNVVMRFAPFLFIFGAAILLLVVMRKRRSHSAE